MCATHDMRRRSQKPRQVREQGRVGTKQDGALAMPGVGSADRQDRRDLMDLTAQRQTNKQSHWVFPLQLG